MSILDAFHFDLSKSQFNVKLAPAITAEGKDEKTSQEPGSLFSFQWIIPYILIQQVWICPFLYFKGLLVKHSIKMMFFCL